MGVGGSFRVRFGAKSELSTRGDSVGCRMDLPKSVSEMDLTLPLRYGGGCLKLVTST